LPNSKKKARSTFRWVHLFVKMESSTSFLRTKRKLAKELLALFTRLRTYSRENNTQWRSCLSRVALGRTRWRSYWTNLSKRSASSVSTAIQTLSVFTHAGWKLPISTNLLVSTRCTLDNIVKAIIPTYNLESSWTLRRKRVLNNVSKYLTFHLKITVVLRLREKAEVTFRTPTIMVSTINLNNQIAKPFLSYRTMDQDQINKRKNSILTSFRYLHFISKWNFVLKDLSINIYLRENTSIEVFPLSSSINFYKEFNTCIRTVWCIET